MNIPKIIFEPMSLEENIDIIKWSFFEVNDLMNLHKSTICCFKELFEVNINGNKEEIYLYIEKVVSKYYNKCINKINDEVQRYNKIWDSYNDNYFRKLSIYLNMNFSSNLKIIKAKVGLIPVFPRYLDTYSFSVSISLEEKQIIDICSHECLHFLWFDKWKKMYSNYSRDEFESPHTIWKYSEMVVDPILNSKEINKVINLNIRAYDNFYNIKDNNDIYVMDKLKNIFNTNDLIEDKIRNGYEYISSVFDNKSI
mgnify:CR=1 FL=1